MKLSLLLLILLFSSCQEKWIDETGYNIIFFNGQTVKTSFSKINDYGDPYFENRSYTIFKKIANDRNKAFNLYILKEDSTHKFALLPEYIENENTRMYETQTINHLIERTENIDSLLYVKTPVMIEGQDSIATIYGIFGSAKGLGRKFTKK